MERQFLRNFMQILIILKKNKPNQQVHESYSHPVQLLVSNTQSCCLLCSSSDC